MKHFIYRRINMKFLTGWRTVIAGAAVTVLPLMDWAFNTGILRSLLINYSWGEAAISSIGALMLWMRFLTKTPVGVQSDE